MTANALVILTLAERLEEITRKADKVARFMVHKFKAQAAQDAGVARVSIQARWLEWKVAAERVKFTPVEWDPSNAHWVYDSARDCFDWPGTGLWIVRGKEKRRRGVASLLAFVASRCAAPPKPVDRA